MAAEAQELTPAWLSPPASPDYVDDALDGGTLKPPLCPCHVVAATVLPQDTCVDALVARTAPPNQRVTASHPLRAVLNRDLEEIRRGLRKNLEIVDPALALATEQVAFVSEDQLADPLALSEHPRVSEVFELTEAVRHFFPEYVFGPSLRSQTGSERVRRQLDRAFKFLRAIGLLDASVIDAHHYAHTSVLMLMRRALGVPNPRWLIPYIRNPALFTATAIENALRPRGGNRRARIDELEILLWTVAEWHPHTEGERTELAVAFPADGAATILASIARRSRDLLTRVKRLATPVAPRTLGNGHGGGAEDDGMDALDEEWLTFERRKHEWLPMNHRDYVVISGNRVLGPFRSKSEALAEAYETFGCRPLLVKQIVEHDEPVLVSPLGV